MPGSSALAVTSHHRQRILQYSRHFRTMTVRFDITLSITGFIGAAHSVVTMSLPSPLMLKRAGSYLPQR